MIRLKTWNLLVVLMVIQPFVFLSAQIAGWAGQFGGTGDDQGYSISVGDSGYVYVAGGFQDTADFDLGPGTANLVSTGTFDISVAKYDSLGNLIWAKSMGGSGTTTAFCRSIHVDPNGDLILTGMFKGGVDFDPGPGTHYLSSVISSAQDIFVVKLNAGGDLIWAKKIGNPYLNRAIDVTTDNSGNIHVTGYFRGTLDFDPGAGISTLTSAGGTSDNDIYVLKLDPNGNYIWAGRMGGSDSDVGQSIVVDSSGNMYVTGHFDASADFDPGPGSAYLAPSGINDVFITKLDASGNFIWAKQVGGNNTYIWSNDNAYAIDIDPFGDLYVSGTFYGTADFDPGPGTHNLISYDHQDIFILKLDSSGSFLWAHGFGGGFADDHGFHVTTDQAGNCYLAGYFGDTIDFDPGVGVHKLISKGDADAFILKLDRFGNYSWALSSGGPGMDRAQGVEVSNENQVYITGFFRDTAFFDYGSGIDSFVPYGGANDAFLMKIGQCPASSATDVISACDSYIWIDGITYTASNNIAKDTLVNAAGCDSIIYLDLTIDYSTTSTDTVVACDSYTWINGTTYTASNTTDTYLLSTAAGCDSLVTLNLTITTLDVSTTLLGADSIMANAVGASYQWLNCDSGYSVIPGETSQVFHVTTFSGGNYAVEVTRNGCADTSACNFLLSAYCTIDNPRISIYPNPSHGLIHVSPHLIGSFEIEITSADGRVIYPTTSFPGEQVDIALNEPAGLYILKLTTGAETKYYKLIHKP